MSGELTRWIASTPAMREHERTLARIDNATNEAVAQIHAVVGVTQTGLLGGTAIGMTRQTAELTLPGESDALTLIANAGQMNIVGIVQAFGRRV